MTIMGKSTPRRSTTTSTIMASMTIMGKSTPRRSITASTIMTNMTITMPVTTMVPSTRTPGRA